MNDVEYRIVGGGRLQVRGTIPSPVPRSLMVAVYTAAGDGPLEVCQKCGGTPKPPFEPEDTCALCWGALG